MHVYRYSFWKLLVGAVGGVAMVWGGYWTTENFAGKAAFLGYMFMVLGPFVTLAALRFLFSDREALRIDPHGIEYKTLFGKERVPWRDFRGTTIETITTRGAFVVSSTARHLKLDFGKGLFGNCSISEKMLGAGATIEEILATLGECLQGAAALDRGEYRHPSLGRGGASAEPGRSISAPAAGGFGRKGL